MSEIENLEYIRDKGIEKFLEKETKRWISEKGILCVHDKKYYNKPTWENSASENGRWQILKKTLNLEEYFPRYSAAY